MPVWFFCRCQVHHFGANLSEQDRGTDGPQNALGLKNWGFGVSENLLLENLLRL